jgi:hypothetical protein
MLSPGEDSAKVGVGGTVGDVTGSGAPGVGVVVGGITSATVDEGNGALVEEGRTGGFNEPEAISVGAGTSDREQARSARKRLPTESRTARRRMQDHVLLPGSAPNLVVI